VVRSEVTSFSGASVETYRKRSTYLSHGESAEDIKVLTVEAVADKCEQGRLRHVVLMNADIIESCSNSSERRYNIRCVCVVEFTDR